MTPVDQMHSALNDRWRKANLVGSISFRSDMSDVLQWICYCTKHQPVEYSFFNKMQAAGVPLPTYPQDEVMQVLATLDQSPVFDGLDRYCN